MGAIEILQESDFEEYDNYINGKDDSLIYHSIAFRRFLEKQTGAQALYLVYKEDGRISGVLPLFIKEGKKGNVINSLPFYGSYGSVIAENEEATSHLLRSYTDLISKHSCLSSTIITSPFDSVNKDLYKELLSYQFTDSRIGQITHMPPTEPELMEIFHFKTRNSVRKGLKSGLTITWEDGLSYLDFVFETHKENLEAIGGLWKQKQTFTNLIESFSYGDQLRIYVAKLNDEPVAALLLLYYNKGVEYFTPVTVAAHRNLQPMSALVYRSMVDAIQNGFTIWNWGGTWLSQGGVYDFKARWGTTDYPYHYYVNAPDIPRIKSFSKQELLSEYEYFYVIPFNQLENAD